MSGSRPLVCTENKGPSRSTLALGAVALFFLSFLMSGSGNALPQVFFQRNYPERKTLLLSVALLASTAAAVAGVLISRRVRARRTNSAIAILLTAGLAEALLSSHTAVTFIACLVLVQFWDNFLVNQIDHAAVARAGSLRGFNDAAGNAARLLGMLSAPAFFTIFSDKPAVERFVTAALGVAAVAGCILLFELHPAPEAGTQLASELKVLDRADRLVFGYAVAIYLALYLFAANIIYLLRDLFHIPGSETRGGFAIVAVFFAALAANGVVAAARRSAAETAGRSVRTAALAAPALLLINAAGLIVAGVRTGYSPFLIGAVAIGAAYGVFLWEMRDYTSRAARQGKTALLTWFNNMANISSLLAFGLMLGLAGARSDAPGAYYIWLMWAIAAVPAGGLVLLACAFNLLRRTAASSQESEQVLKPA